MSPHKNINHFITKIVQFGEGQNIPFIAADVVRIVLKCFLMTVIISADLSDHSLGQKV